MGRIAEPAGEADALGSPLRRVVVGSKSRSPGHEHLVDAMAVHVHNLEGEPLPLEAVARRRYAPEVAIAIPWAGW